jgi:hypothetical protein
MPLVLGGTSVGGSPPPSRPVGDSRRNPPSIGGVEAAASAASAHEAAHLRASGSLGSIFAHGGGVCVYQERRCSASLAPPLSGPLQGPSEVAEVFPVRAGRPFRGRVR